MRNLLQLFINNYNKLHTEVVLCSSFTLIMAGLLAAFIFGYVTWETCDSLFQDTELLTASEAQVIYIKRAVCISIFLLTLFAIGYAYTNTFDPISTSVPISPATAQSLITPDSFLDSCAKNLRINPTLLEQTIKSATSNVASKEQLVYLFDIFYGNTQIGKMTSLNNEAKAYLVRILLRLYMDPQHLEIVRAGAEVYIDYKNGLGPKPATALPFLQYLVIATLKL